MNQPLKQRIIGAIVLISLAIIFIPALLDGSHKNVSPLKEHRVPQKPNFYFEEIKLPASVDSGKAPSHIIDNGKELSPSQNSKKIIAEKTAEVSQNVEKADLPPAKKEPSSTAPFAWVVQIVSLTNATRALELRDKLKKQAFSAFVEETTKDGRKFYRVRVGPELKQEEAEKLQQKIKKKMKLEGRVMRYRPL